MTKHDLKKATAALVAAALIVPHGAISAFAADAAAAAKPAAASFLGVDVADDLVTIRLTAPVQYNSFLTQTPPRLVLELLDADNQADVRTNRGRGRYLAAVRSSQFQTAPRRITRVVLDLAKMAVYKIEADPKGLRVRLVGSGDEASAEAADETAPAPRGPAAVATAPRPQGLQDAVAPSPSPVPEPAKPARSAKDLSAAAAFKRAGMQGKMSSELVGAVQAEDTSVNTAVIPKDVGDESAGEHVLGGRIYRDIISRMPRDPVSLDFDGTDVRDVLKLLAAKARINIIYGSDVTGMLTLHLSDVPFNEAFRSVLSMMQLSTDQVGDNILRVITPAALAAQRTSASAITKVVPLNYAKAASVKTTIDAVRTAEGRSGSSSIDLNTNSIVITESLEGMLATENLINQLDQRPRQVLIEAKLIEVNANSGLDYGIQWNAYGNQNGSFAGQKGTTLIGSTAGIGSGASGSPATTGYNANLLTNPITTTLGSTGGIGAAGQGTGVGLPADNIFGAFTLGRVTSSYLLNATITAAASEGKAKVLSDPKITTLNNQAANINVTTQIPYVTANVASTGVQTQTVNYANVGIQLTVTPSINADGRILLNINPDVSQPSVTAAANTQTGAPAVDTRKAQTSVLVRDGETVVIGGLISDSMQDTISKIPLLGDIPILGWLFKKKTKTRTRNELLIFVTTHILPD